MGIDINTVKRDLNKKPHTILVAEDDQNIQLLYHDSLEEEGFQVVKVGNGMEVLFYLEHDMVDLIITDTKMPIMDGLRMIKEVQQKYPGLPIVVVSGNYRKEDFDALGIHVQAIYSKPADLKEIKKRICEILCISS